MTRINAEEARQTALAELRRQVVYLGLLAKSAHDIGRADGPWLTLMHLRDCYTSRARRIRDFLDEYRHRR